jgi:hypothetical protein
MAARYRLELLLLLAKPLLLALQAGNAAAAEAMLVVLQQEACTEQPEVLRDVLLLLANQVSSQQSLSCQGVGCIVAGAAFFGAVSWHLQLVVQVMHCKPLGVACCFVGTASGHHVISWHATYL